MTPVCRQIVANGPDGGSGTLFGAGSYCQSADRAGVYVGDQTWRRAPGATWWIGWYTAERPTPEELARSRQIPGENVTLGDGRLWHVPIARSCVDGDNGLPSPAVALPRKMDMTADGQWTIGGVLDQYAALYHVAERWWEFLMSAIADQDDHETTEREVTLSIDSAADWCCTALGTNYRVSAIEIWCLDLLNDLTRADVLNVVVDLQTWRNRIAKKNSAGSGILNTNAGNAA